MKRIKWWKDLVAFGTALGITVASMPLCAVHAETPSSEEMVDSYCRIIVNAVNDARVENGLPEVAILPEISGYAKTSAEEIVESFSHTRPDGRGWSTVMKDDGFFYNTAAENIAAGNYSPVATFEQWMNSEGHYKNIMKSDITHIAISYVYDPSSMYQHYWSMLVIGVYDTNAKPLVFDDQYLPGRSMGDVDGNLDVNVSDASKILLYSAEMSSSSTAVRSDEFLKAADVNEDGMINAIDASIVQAYAAVVGAIPDADFADIKDYIW